MEKRSRPRKTTVGGKSKSAAKNRGFSQPVRTCVGYREAKDKGELIRLCMGEGQGLEFDLGGKKPGRGAYLCLRAKCIGEAVRKSPLSRSLKDNNGDRGAKELEEKILAALERELSILLCGEGWILTVKSKSLANPFLSRMRKEQKGLPSYGINITVSRIL